MSTSSSWTDISADPNDPSVVAARQASLDRARRATITDRLAHLRGLAAGRKVLDVGVVEHFASNSSHDKWLHRHLVEVASQCRGVDILEPDVAELVGKGFDITVHDLTASPLDDEFELVVMGEVVEHLGAPQAMLGNIAKMLGSDGRLVLTTPNPYMLNRTWHSLRGRFPDSVDHATLLGPGNIAELAGRTGFALDAWRGVRLKDLPGLRNRVTTVARRSLVRLAFAEEIACDTIIYELVPAT